MVWIRLLTRRCARGVVHLVHHIRKAPTRADPPLPPPSPIIATLTPWTVFTDGSWYPVNQDPARAFGQENDHGGGSGIIFIPQGAPLPPTPSVAICVDAMEGGVRVMELVGIAGALAYEEPYTLITKGWSPN